MAGGCHCIGAPLAFDCWSNVIRIVILITYCAHSKSQHNFFLDLIFAAFTISASENIFGSTLHVHVATGNCPEQFSHVMGTDTVQRIAIPGVPIPILVSVSYRASVIQVSVSGLLVSVSYWKLADT